MPRRPTRGPAVALRLGAVRAARGLSLGEIHRRSGINRTLLTKIENGSRPNPGIQHLAWLAIAIAGPKAGKRKIVAVLDELIELRNGATP